MWPFTKKKTTAKRAFAGALQSRLTADWVLAATTSQDSEIRGSLSRLRARSRQLIRDDDFARQAIRTIRNNVIGQGVGMQSQVRQPRTKRLETATNDAIERAWSEWCRKDSCDAAGQLSFQDIERLLVSSVAADGEIYVRMIRQPFGRSRVPFGLQIIEADLLDEEKNEVAPSGAEIRMGVERNQWGRPIAYHFKTKHPGDFQFGYPGTVRAETQRIPAEEIIPLFVSDRPGQTRGVPWLASAIIRLHQMKGYQEAEIVAARASAALMGFIETPEGELRADDVQEGQRVTEFEPGVFKQLNPGEKVHVPQLQRPAGQFDPFMRAMLRGVAAGIGCSFESISRDFSQTNYSSSRLSLLEDRDNWRVLQSWMIENFHRVVFEAWLDMAVLSGVLQLPGYELNPERYRSVRWMPRGWSWVDPAKEVAAFKEAVRAGFMTQADVIAQGGGDLEELLAQRQREVEMAGEMGLVFDTDPGVEQKQAEAEAAADAQAQAEAQAQADAQGARALEETIKIVREAAPKVDVHVAPPAVTVAAAPIPNVSVTVERSGKTLKTVERDENGLIKNIIEKEAD